MALPLTASREYFRKKLNSLLEIADDEGLIQLLWAANALQAGEEDAAARYLTYRYPKSAVTTDISAQSFIYKWELETIANELLTIPKRIAPKRGRHRALITDNYQSIVKIVNFLRKLENTESSRGLNDRSIFRELDRIGNQQFDWQRGYLNLPQFYRNAFVYGQGACAAYFEAKHGITINQLSLVGFVIHTLLTHNPIFARHNDLTLMGVSVGNLERCLAIIACPIADMRKLAEKKRSAIYHTAYRPSIFRLFPCITFGDQNETVRTPLPQLILERVTAGVFYDVVGGGGEVRNDYGRRFEEYCLSYLRSSLPSLDWREEGKYRVRTNQVDTPDILLTEGIGLGLVIECKATRMSYIAKFGDGNVNERGFEDIVKAVFQLWRFFSHSRRGISGFSINTDAVGAVLTLDNWLIMQKPIHGQDDVMAAAKAMATAKDTYILEEDQRPIAFFSITDLEATLVKATGTSYLQAVRACADPKYHGWMLTNVHHQFEEPDQSAKEYPFRNDMGRLLPWWDMFERKKAKHASVA